MELMGIYVSELRIFDNGTEDITFLGSILASDIGLKELSDFVGLFGDIRRSDSRQRYSASITDAFFLPSKVIPRYVITPKCRREALKLGAKSMPLAQLVNKCSNGNLREAWNEIYPFCV